MARRPSTPRPRPGSVRPAAPRRTVQPSRSAGSAPSAPSSRTAHSAASPSPAPASSPERGTARGRGRSLGRPAPPSETPAPARSSAPAQEEHGGGRVVQAADRFRELVAGRPWRRRRRAILATIAVGALVLVAGLAAAVMVPALQVREIAVAGTGYVSEDAVREAVAGHTGDSVLLLPASRIAAEASEVPGVSSAVVERDWPDGMTVTVTEADPVGQLTRADGSTAVVDAAGEELPAEAAEGATLVPLSVEGGAADPDGAAATMTEVLATLPDPLRGATQEITASSASDVTLELSLEDGGTKTVVWGDSRDAELKGDVVQALLDQPGSVIDVSSPVAPVTR